MSGWFDYDAWKTTPPDDTVECADCGSSCSGEFKRPYDGEPLCRGCLEEYNPNLP